LLEPQRVAANIAQLRHGDSLIVTGNLGGQAIGAVLQQVAARALLRVHKVRFRCPNCGLQRASIEAAVKSLLARTGNKLDAVLHNAGVAAAGVFEDVPESELRRVMETNFFGILGLTRTLLPTFRAQRNGRIVVVSSEAAFMGQLTNSIYCASKWAIEGWAEAIAYELEPFGIELILIEPGPYRTEIWKARRVFSRSAAHIMRGCGRCSGQAMRMPPVWRATPTRERSSLPAHLTVHGFERRKVDRSISPIGAPTAPTSVAASAGNAAATSGFLEQAGTYCPQTLAPVVQT
jgi:NAD(P)-dependent dehydrogenase (short-subunit alcohol dehydrogenase family)